VTGDPITQAETVNQQVTFPVSNHPFNECHQCQV